MKIKQLAVNNIRFLRCIIQSKETNFYLVKFGLDHFDFKPLVTQIKYAVKLPQ